MHLISHNCLCLICVSAFRNEVWRFNPQEFSTHGKRFRSLFFRGFPIGFGAFVLTIIAEKMLVKPHGSEHGHEDH